MDLARSALFFDGARIAGPILVLVGWAGVGTALVIALGGRIVDMVEAEAAAGAALWACSRAPSRALESRSNVDDPIGPPRRLEGISTTAAP